MSINILKTKVYNGKNEPRVPCQIPWLHPVLQDAFKIVLDQAFDELTYLEINLSFYFWQQVSWIFKGHIRL